MSRSFMSENIFQSPGNEKRYWTFLRRKSMCMDSWIQGLLIFKTFLWRHSIVFSILSYEYCPLVSCDHPCGRLFVFTHAEIIVHCYKNGLSNICKNEPSTLVRMDNYFRVSGDKQVIVYIRWTYIQCIYDAWKRKITKYKS